MNLGQERCGVTGKVMFPTVGAAQGFASAVGRKLGAKLRPENSACPWCKSWHTTKGARGRSKRIR